MDTIRSRCTHRGGGRSCRLPGILAGAILLALLVSCPVAAQEPPGSEERNPHDWKALLEAHAYDSARARVVYLEGLEQWQAGDVDAAEGAFAEASKLDGRFAKPHSTRASMLLRQGNPAAVAEFLESLARNFRGYRNQSRWAANVLLGVDLVLALALLWVLVGLLIRYLPFVQHELASRLDAEHHLDARMRWLWMPLLTAMGLAWGLLPLLALTVPIVWLHAERRVRVLIAAALLFFAVQGTPLGPFGSVLVGTDPTSVPALVERAAYEAPTQALLRDIDEALAARGNDDADLLLARGLVLARRGEFEKSNRSFLANLERRPQDPISTNNVACNHFFLGKIDRAVAGFQRSVALDSTRAAPHYNLGQAYMQKLFLREGGASLRRALELGFVASEQQEPLPRGAVCFLRPSAWQLWTLAWHERADMAPFDLLHAYASWLGAPIGHLPFWLVGTLAVSLLLGIVVRREALVFECVNCGHLACRTCQGEHEGAVLCRGCSRTAHRARSEMVLQTLLRNRRRDAELAYAKRLRRLDRWVLGMGRLADGVRARGLWTAFILGAVCAALILGRAPLTDPWGPLEEGWLTPLRWFALAVLAVLAAVNGILEAPARGRHLQPHPSSIVSLVGLIEGRAPSRVRRGGQA